MAVEKDKLSAGTVKVGVDVVLLGYGGELSIVEQPDNTRWRANGAKLHLVAGASAVDMFVEAIVEQIIPIAAARV